MADNAEEISKINPVTGRYYHDVYPGRLFPGDGFIPYQMFLAKLDSQDGKMSYDEYSEVVMRMSDIIFLSNCTKIPLPSNTGDLDTALKKDYDDDILRINKH